MMEKQPKEKPLPPKGDKAQPAPAPAEDTTPPDYTRYGDWQIKGKCVDF